jgi:hypothetical protein
MNVRRDAVNGRLEDFFEKFHARRIIQFPPNASRENGRGTRASVRFNAKGNGDNQRHEGRVRLKFLSVLVFIFRVFRVFRG